MAESKAPNLIFLFADQLRYQACGYSGESRARTPNIDRLASQGMNFDNAVSVFPLCGPMRACLFTGKYPTSTGMFRNDIRCMPDPDAIGHVLTQASYQTAYIGKWHLYGRESNEQYIPPGPYRLGFDDYWASYAWNIDYWNGYYYHDTPEKQHMSGFQTDYLTTLALDQLARRDPDRPFALFISYEVPHPPLTRDNVPPEYYVLFENVDFSDLLFATDEVFDQFTPAFDRQWQQEHIIERHQERSRAYYAMIACLDHNVGRIMAFLDEHDLAEDTVFVFTSDHGEMLGAHGRGNKRIFYEESIRVPFLIRWHGQIPAGTSNDAHLNTPDIAPSLLGLLRLPMPKSMEGFSYAPSMRGIPQPNCPGFAFMQVLHGSQLNHHEEWRGVRDHRFLYARLLRNDKEFLFDHQNDPRELQNLASYPDYQFRLSRYRALLAKTASQLQDDLRLPEWYEEHWLQDGCVIRSAIRSLDESSIHTQSHKRVDS
jgi:arylsulfatase A-like enzyme